MEGTGDTSGAEDLEGLLQELGQESAGDTQQGYLDAGSQKAQLAPSTPQAGAAQQATPQANAQQQAMLAGKYRTPQDLEKGYKNLEQLAGKHASKLKQLEALIRDPRFQRLAAGDPDIKQSLGKLGYELRQQELEEARQDQSRGPQEFDENSSEFKLAALEEAMNLRWELFEFGQQRGKALSRDEEKAVRQVISMAPRLSVTQAYKLTNFYEQELKAKEEAARARDAQGRFQKGNRPAPNPQLLPGQKLDLKKSVTEMNELERRAYLSELVDKNQ